MQLRPRGVGEILDAAFRLCFTHWRPLMTATLVVVVPVQIFATIVLFSAFPDNFTTEDAFFGPQTSQDPAFSPVTNEDVGVLVAGQIVSGVLTGLMVLLTIAACFKAVADAYLGTQPDWRSSVRFAVARLGPLLWITVLYVLGVVLGFMALLIPGIFLMFAWNLSFPAALVEGVRGAGALKRSFQLVRGRWWPVFGVQLVGFILVAVIAGIVQSVFLLPVLFVDSLLAVAVLTGLASIVGYAISTPLQAAIVAIVFFDQRVRKEGLDLELLAQSLGTEGPPAPAGGGSPSPGTQVPPGWAPPGGAEPPPQR
ncbi:MAG: hypothetical protein WKF99_09545 [Solirubrobacteraceae bacterium]